MRKETDLARVKMIAHVLLDMPIAETSFSPAIVSHPFTSTGVTATQNEDGNITVVDLLNNKEDYPNLASQDTANIPKTIEDNGRTLTLQNISWQTDNTANTDGYAMGDRFTAVATYTGSATSSYVTGYTVTADYSGTVSRIALNKTRYVAIFEGTAIEPLAPLPDSESSPVQFNWAYILVPLGVVFAAGGVIGGCLLYKRKHESEEESE